MMGFATAAGGKTVSPSGEVIGTTRNDSTRRTGGDVVVPASADGAARRVCANGIGAAAGDGTTVGKDDLVLVAAADGAVLGAPNLVAETAGDGAPARIR